MKNKTTLKSFNLFSICLIAILWLNSVNAQDTTVYELFENDFQMNAVQSKTLNKSAALKSNANKNETANSGFQNFLELNNNLRPTVYVDKNSIVNITGPEKPVKLKYSNIQAFNKLNEDNSLLNSVELITINIENSNDLNNKFDVSKINDFQKLKYVFIKCNFNCSVDQIKQFVLNLEPEVIVYFTKVNPS